MHFDKCRFNGVWLGVVSSIVPIGSFPHKMFINQGAFIALRWKAERESEL